MSKDIYEKVDDNIKDNPELQKKVLKLFADQAKEAVEIILELDSRLSRINLQTNGAAAIAILAFIGSGLAPNEIAYALLIFVLGVITAAIQVRCQLGHYNAFFERTSAGQKSIRERKFQLDKAMKKSAKEIVYDKVNMIMGLASQLLFVVGVVSSSWIFWRYSHGDVSVTFGML